MSVAAFAWGRHLTGSAVIAAAKPITEPPALLTAIEALVNKSAATGAKTITVACTHRELTIVDDGRGLPKLEALFDDDGSFRRSLLALSQKVTLYVMSTHVHVRNRACIGVHAQTIVNHERTLPPSPSSIGRGGFSVITAWKVGTQITITEVAEVLATRRTQLGNDLEARLRSKHPGITINVTL